MRVVSSIFARNFRLLARCAVAALFGIGLFLQFNLDLLLTDLLSHFRHLYLLIGLMALPVLWHARARFDLFLCIAGMALHSPALLYLPYRLPLDPHAGNNGKIRVLSANVHVANRSYQSLVDALKSQRPTIAVLTEVSEEWRHTFAAIRPDFPYQAAIFRDDCFGIALLSKLPFERIIRERPSGLPPIIEARFNMNRVPFRLIGIHAVPPVGDSERSVRNRSIAEAADLAAKAEGGVIIAGDLNTAMWSAPYRELIEAAPLRDPRLGRGIFATWPASIWPAILPIDHILHSAQFRSAALQTFSLPGSDHRGIVVELLLDKPAIR